MATNLDFGKVFNQSIMGAVKYKMDFDESKLREDMRIVREEARADLAQRNYEATRDYSIGRDAIVDERYEATTKYGKERDDVTDKRNALLDKVAENAVVEDTRRWNANFDESERDEQDLKDRLKAEAIENRRRWDSDVLERWGIANRLEQQAIIDNQRASELHNAQLMQGEQVYKINKRKEEIAEADYGKKQFLEKSGIKVNAVIREAMSLYNDKNSPTGGNMEATFAYITKNLSKPEFNYAMDNNLFAPLQKNFSDKGIEQPVTKLDWMGKFATGAYNPLGFGSGYFLQPMLGGIINEMFKLSGNYYQVQDENFANLDKISKPENEQLQQFLSGTNPKYNKQKRSQ